MQTENRLLDDLARMANGALNTLSGLREEIESRVRERVERMLADMDMVPREEFDAVKAMAQKARAEQEDLAARVGALEQRIAALGGAAAGPKKPATPDRTTARRTSPRRPAGSKTAK
jgi:BMFP domain-containing protein YqiC